MHVHANFFCRIELHSVYNTFGAETQVSRKKLAQESLTHAKKLLQISGTGYLAIWVVCSQPQSDCLNLSGVMQLVVVGVNPQPRTDPAQPSIRRQYWGLGAPIGGSETPSVVTHIFQCSVDVAVSRHVASHI